MPSDISNELYHQHNLPELTIHTHLQETSDTILDIFEVSDWKNKRSILIRYYDYPNWMSTFFGYNLRGWTTNYELEKIMDFAVLSNQVEFKIWKYDILWKQEQADMKWKKTLVLQNAE